MSGPVIAFRTEGGADVGLGHVRRCMTLAEALQNDGGVARFVVNEDPSVERLLRKHGFPEVTVGGQADRDLSQTLNHVRRWDVQALVVDSYSIEGECFEHVREPTLVVLDDLADRCLPVDLVVNGAAHARELYYQTSSRTKLLLGPEYALLRQEFISGQARRIRERVERVLITVGGRDPGALSPCLILWTQEVIDQVAIDVIIGPFFSPTVCREIECLAKDSCSITFYREPPNMHDLMLACDVAITGGGQTTYELAATGTPAVAIRLADNQTRNLSGLSEAGALVWAGDVHDTDLEAKTKRAIADLAGEPARRAALSRKGRVLVDGLGAARISRAILSLAPSSRK